MSVICGIYYVDNHDFDPRVGNLMLRELGKYSFNDSGRWDAGRIFFGCYLQSITPESAHEKLPYEDQLAAIAITADAILDNRAELVAKLGLDRTRQAEIPDSLLILKAYQKWGTSCPERLLGDFAFAIWDGQTRELFCAVDPTGNRTFYYYSSPRLFGFSTLIRPLFAIPEVSREYSEAWICDFLANPAVTHQLDCGLTPYRDIRLLPAGHTLTVNTKGISKQVYWKAERRQELRLASDREYEEAWRDVLDQAVRCRARSIRPVGVMLSGGLDSTTVAALAARELQAKGQALQAFSSVPIKGYHGGLPSGQIADETPYIEAVREYAENIAVTYCRFEGRHALSEVDRYIEIFEQPYKILENLFWTDGILGLAAERKIGVMLTGGLGNTTISYGPFGQCAAALLRSGQWRRLVREINAYTKLRQCGLRSVLADLVKSRLPYEAQQAWQMLRNKNWDAPLQLSPINPHFAKALDSRGRFKQFRLDPLFIQKTDAFKYRQMKLSPANFSHMACVYTKLGLAHGLVIRDPTMDKRVIEFCLGVPVEQFIRDGRERDLLRRAMGGILPDKVRLNYKERGRQSADYRERLTPVAAAIREEIMEIGRLELEQKYLDVGRMHRIAALSGLMDETANERNLRMLLRSIIFSRFLRQKR